MKICTLAMGACVAVLFGCASNQQVLDYSMGQAEKSREVASEMKIDPSATAKASAGLDSAKSMLNEGEKENAVVMANLSSLEYKLALSMKERDDVRKMDEQLEKDLRADLERKAFYQETLEKEVKGGK